MESVDIVIGNVKNEVHNIAKLIFIKEIEDLGFKVLDLGENVSCEKFINKIREKKAKILVLTGVFNSAIGHMENIIKNLKEDRLRKNIKILIAGPNINKDWLKRTKADAIANSISLGKKILLSWKEI